MPLRVQSAGNATMWPGTRGGGAKPALRLLSMTVCLLESYVVSTLALSTSPRTVEAPMAASERHAHWYLPQFVIQPRSGRFDRLYCHVHAGQTRREAGTQSLRSPRTSDGDSGVARSLS